MGVLIGIIGAVLLGLMCYVLWRYWTDVTARTPDSDRYERRIAALNERQANRYSDDQLKNPVDGDDAWALMVQRGKRIARRPRYSGSFARRNDERRNDERRKR